MHMSHVVPSTVAMAFALLRDKRGRAARDLPIDQIELALNLPARLLHAEELCQRLRKDRHGDVLRCQPMKLEGPPYTA